MPVLTSPPLVGGASKPVTGRVAISATAAYTWASPDGDRLVTTTPQAGIVRGGQFFDLDSNDPLTLPPTPEGIGMRIVLHLDEQGARRGEHRVSRVVSVPDVATVTWAGLEDIEPAFVGPDYVIPDWASEVFAAADTLDSVRNPTLTASGDLVVEVLSNGATTTKNVGRVRGDSFENPRRNAAGELLIDRRVGSTVTTVNVGQVTGDSVKNPRLSGDNLVVDVVVAGVTSAVTVGNVRGPRGLPGLNAVENDQAFAAALEAAGSASNGVLRRVLPHLSVKEYGATGDGITDDTAAIQSAVNAAATFGASVLFPAGRYRITTTLSLPSRTVLRGVGGGRSVIDMTGMGSAVGSPKTAMGAIGTLSTETHSIVADVPALSKTATLADGAASSYAVGDRVLLSSDQTFHMSAALKRGEIKRIEAISGDVITFEDATYDSYAATSGAKVAKLTPVSGIALHDLVVEGTDLDNMERGLYVYCGEDVTVAGCTFNHTDWNSINFRHVTNFKVTGNTFRNDHWISDGPNYYGLVVENASAHGVFSGNHGTRCRHLFTTGYTTGTPGVTRFVVVSNNVDTYSQSSSYDTHDGSEFISFIGNTSSFSEANGISCEGRETLIADNHIVGFQGTGINVYAAAENITIRGNRVIGGGASNANAIYLRKTHSTHRPRNLVVTDNILSAPYSALRVLDVDNLTATGNQFVSAQSNYSVYFRGTRGRFANNSGTGSPSMFFLADASDCIITGNDSGGSTYGVRMSGTTTRTIITGNNFTGATKGVYSPIGSYKIASNYGESDASA